jgi:hypothetical protein
MGNLQGLFSLTVERGSGGVCVGAYAAVLLLTGKLQRQPKGTGRASLLMLKKVLMS